MRDRQEIQGPDENYQIRCPRLGHQIAFVYCRQEDRGQPCFKILDCWHAHFDVAAYLKAELDPEQWEALGRRPVKPKVLSLVELIEQAKEREGAS